MTMAVEMPDNHHASRHILESFQTAHQDHGGLPAGDRVVSCPIIFFVAPAQVPGTACRMRMVGITSPSEPLSRGMQYNVFGLCVRAGFGAQNCQPALHLNRSTKLQVCTSPRLTQNPCYAVVVFSRCIFCQFSQY